MTKWQRFRQWLWSFLPDNCEMPGCCRQGVRGNENFIDGKVVCDYCHAKMIRAETQLTQRSPLKCKDKQFSGFPHAEDNEDNQRPCEDSQAHS